MVLSYNLWICDEFSDLITLKQIALNWKLRHLTITFYHLIINLQRTPSSLSCWIDILIDGRLTQRNDTFLDFIKISVYDSFFLRNFFTIYFFYPIKFYEGCHCRSAIIEHDLLKKKIKLIIIGCVIKFYRKYFLNKR